MRQPTRAAAVLIRIQIEHALASSGQPKMRLVLDDTCFEDGERIWLRSPRSSGQRHDADLALVSATAISFGDRTI